MSRPSGILMTQWGRIGDEWAMTGLRSLDLVPREGYEPDFFAVESRMEPPVGFPAGQSVHQLLNTLGPTDYLLRQSILPVVAHVRGERRLRCIGTAFVISCSGLVLTATHVLLDPEESSYGRVLQEQGLVRFPDDLSMGVIVPLSPTLGSNHILFAPFEYGTYWAQWRESPLVLQPPSVDILLDVAICRIPRLPDGLAYQPLGLSLNPFQANETAMAIGYAEMPDIEVEDHPSGFRLRSFSPELFVSRGPVSEVFRQNLVTREVPTPGPCFDFRALVPGKMSGSPIFGADGAVVRGVVSRSFSGERHAYGAMVDPILRIPLRDGRSIRDVMKDGREGMPQIRGAGM